MVGDAQDLIKNLVHGRFKRTLCMGGAIFRGCMGVSTASPPCPCVGSERVQRRRWNRLSISLILVFSRL